MPLVEYPVTSRHSPAVLKFREVMLYKSIRICLIVTILLVFTPDSKLHAQNDENHRPKVGLVLSGGGAKGLAHIGVLNVLEEVGIYPDYISGTSMGSIVGGLYAIGYSVEVLP